MNGLKIKKVNNIQLLLPKLIKKLQGRQGVTRRNLKSISPHQRQLKTVVFQPKFEEGIKSKVHKQRPRKIRIDASVMKGQKAVLTPTFDRSPLLSPIQNLTIDTKATTRNKRKLLKTSKAQRDQNMTMNRINFVVSPRNKNEGPDNFYQNTRNGD